MINEQIGGGNVRDAIFAACLEAAHSMGSDVTKMSWFARNHREQVEQQKAA